MDGEGDARNHQNRARPLDQGETLAKYATAGRYGDNRNKIDEH
jgi:hypothetical protein